MQFTEKEFEDLKLKAEEEYKQIGEVRCPYLDEKIIFNSEGLEHLEYKRWNLARNTNDQFIRLKLLHFAPKIVQKSHTLQGINEGNRLERIKINNKWEHKMVHVTYYEFISIVNNWRIKIVVKKINNSPPFFWSIIPSGRLTEYRRKVFEGDPEEA